MWERDLAAVAKQLPRLDAQHEVDRVAGGVSRWGRAVAHSTFYLPIPQLARERPNAKGRWVSDDFVGATDIVGFDDGDRPVVAWRERGTARRPLFVWRHDVDGLVLEELDLAAGAVRHLRQWTADGTVLLAAGHRLADLSDVRICHGPLDRLQRVDGARRFADQPPVAFTRSACWSPDGTLDAIAAAVETPDPQVPGRPGTLQAALERAPLLVASEIIWDGAVEAYQPWAPEFASAGTSLAEACAEAIQTATVKVDGLDDVAWIDVRIDPSNEERVLPPRARAVTASWARATAQEGAAVGLEILGEAWAADDQEAGVVELALRGALGDQPLAACRAISTALEPGAPDAECEQAAATLRQFADALAERLTTHPTLCLVQVADSSGRAITDALERARRTRGADALNRLLRLIRA